MPMFDAFIESQAAVIASQRICILAMNNPLWKNLQPDISSRAVANFAKSLEVAHLKNTELIQISFTGQTPALAAAAVRSLIQAYQQTYGEKDGDNAADRMAVLEERRATLSRQLKSIDDRILAIAREYGTSDLTRIYQFRQDEMQRLESELHRIQIAIAALNAADANNPSSDSPLADAIVIAAVDPLMRDYVRQQAETLTLLQRLQQRLGTNHPSVRDLTASLAAINLNIARYAAQFHDHAIKSPVTGNSPNDSLAWADLSQLRQREKYISSQFDKARSETLDVGRKQLVIDSLHAEGLDVRTRLQETTSRIEQLNIESTVSGRLSVISDGELPLRPDSDKRLPLTAGLGFAGSALGVAIILALGLLDRRYHDIADARIGCHRSVKLLGILPQLPHNPTSPEQIDAIANYVHRIRGMLQIHANSSDSRTIAVTSPSPGAGKTSLAIALGLSFAASGSKTLLIDCDLFGKGLTSRMQPSSSSGLLNALAGENLHNCLSPTDVANLFILPLGPAGPQNIGQFSPNAIRRILQEARKTFNTVIVDTGPILGSVEASMAAAQVDCVVGVISRGESQTLANRAIEHLSAINATLAGLVFNRAAFDDILTSEFSSVPSSYSPSSPTSYNPPKPSRSSFHLHHS